MQNCQTPNHLKTSDTSATHTNNNNPHIYVSCFMWRTFLQKLNIPLGVRGLKREGAINYHRSHLSISWRPDIQYFPHQVIDEWRRGAIRINLTSSPSNCQVSHRCLPTPVITKLCSTHAEYTALITHCVICSLYSWDYTWHTSHLN